MIVTVAMIFMLWYLHRLVNLNIILLDLTLAKREFKGRWGSNTHLCIFKVFDIKPKLLPPVFAHHPPMDKVHQHMLEWGIVLEASTKSFLTWYLLVSGSRNRTGSSAFFPLYVLGLQEETTWVSFPLHPLWDGLESGIHLSADFLLGLVTHSSIDILGLTGSISVQSQYLIALRKSGKCSRITSKKAWMNNYSLYRWSLVEAVLRGRYLPAWSRESERCKRPWSAPKILIRFLTAPPIPRIFLNMSSWT